MGAQHEHWTQRANMREHLSNEHWTGTANMTTTVTSCTFQCEHSQLVQHINLSILSLTNRVFVSDLHNTGM